MTETTSHIWYFLSDAHLGVPNENSSLEREKRLVQWLDSISHDAEKIFLVGDIFDFWFEYKTVVPKGYTRLLGKIAQLTDQGIEIHFFTGNHDLWTFGYLAKETGMIIHDEPLEISYDSKLFYIAHGDGLGPGDKGYKFIKSVFRSKICQWLFARLHPNFAVGLANYFSRKSRLANGDSYLKQGVENFAQVVFAKEMLKHNHYHYFVFGHTHSAIKHELTSDSQVVFLGDWITHFSYGRFEGKEFTINSFENR